LSKSHLF
jgi:hypothetical protein